MLVAHFEHHDTVGQWMAHHLAELIVAAQDDKTTSVEQRQQIIETILQIWTNRRYLPGRAPLQEFSNIFTALDRLGDDRPWKFSRLFNADTETPDPSTSRLPLVATAAELERLTRDTLLRLIWLAAQAAKHENQQWLETADRVTSNMESDVTATLSRLRIQAARRRLRATDVTEIASGTPGVDAYAEVEAGAAEDRTHDAATDDIEENSSGERDDASLDHQDDESDDGNTLSDVNNAKRLREMARLLDEIADALDDPGHSEVSNISDREWRGPANSRS